MPPTGPAVLPPRRARQGAGEGLLQLKRSAPCSEQTSYPVCARVPMWGCRSAGWAGVLALCCVRCCAPDTDPSLWKPQLEAALQRFRGGAELMDCSYPNRRQWWESLSEQGIALV